MSRRNPPRASAQRGISAGLAALAVLLATGVASAQSVPVPDGYRMDAYRAPVPPLAPGATTVDTAAVQALISEGRTVLIDVLPRPPRPAGLPVTTVWLPKPRRSLPGAIWLPNVGFGALSDEQRRYFSGHLKRLTAEVPDVRLVFYCLPDCWMSWNAARRAVEWGYGRVYWYPEGTEGWKAAGLALELVRPAPNQR